MFVLDVKETKHFMVFNDNLKPFKERNNAVFTIIISLFKHSFVPVKRSLRLIAVIVIKK